MAKSKQHRRRLYKVENTPVKETPRYDGDGTEWIFESPDGGKTIYKRAMGSDKKILVNGSKQLELFPKLYSPEWECEHCGEDTSRLDYDYLGDGYNHLKCDLEEETRSDEWKVEQYNRNRDSKDHIQEWPGLDAINKEWV